MVRVQEERRVGMDWLPKPVMAVNGDTPNIHVQCTHICDALVVYSNIFLKLHHGEEKVPDADIPFLFVLALRMWKATFSRVLSTTATKL